MKYQKNVEAALVKLMREHGGTLTIDTATQPDQAVTLERMADAGIVVLVSRGAAGTSVYRLCEQQFEPGQPVTWEPGGNPIAATVVRVTAKYIEIMFHNVHGGSEVRRVLRGKVHLRSI
jgi:hypothetical protein